MDNKMDADTDADKKIVVWVPLIKTTMEIKLKDFNSLIFVKLGHQTT